MGGKGRSPAELHATGLGLVPTDSGALNDPLTLPARRDPQHGNDHLGKLRGGVHHRLRDRAEAGPRLIHSMEDVQQVAGVAGEAIGGRHHQHVAGIERADRALEPGPLGRRGAGLLLVDLHAAGGEELGHLLSEVLAGGGDARIAVDHAIVVHRIYASRKRPDFCGFQNDAEPMSFASLATASELT